MQTLKRSQQVLRANGITLTKTEGEYSVYAKGDKAHAYFTDDIADAVATGLSIARNNGTLVDGLGNKVIGRTQDAVVNEVVRQHLTLANDAYKAHGRLEFKTAIRKVPVGDKFVVRAAGRSYTAKANAYGNWYGYIGSTKVTMFWGDYIDQQFEGFDWVNLLGNASALATV